MGLNDAHALTPSIARVGRGLFARNTSPRATPALPLELYEFESCPFCRKVRDVLSELDLGYVDRMGPAVDLHCLVLTAGSVMSGEGAR